jgi:hypothetical protein
MLRRRFVKFPQDFVLEPGAKSSTLPQLVASPFPYYARLLAKTFPNEWQFLSVELNGCVVHLALNGWTIHPKPVRSPSQTSQAIYYAYAETGSFGFLLGSLPSHAHTSSHWHKDRCEYYYLIAGQAEIGLKPHCPKLEVPGKSQAIVDIANGPEGFHPVITTDQPSLIIVQMEENLDRNDHHYGC